MTLQRLLVGGTKISSGDVEADQQLLEFFSVRRFVAFELTISGGREGGLPADSARCPGEGMRTRRTPPWWGVVPVRV
jgi:hypothetical protein